MKVTELIRDLGTIKRTYGDIFVVYPSWMTDGCGAGEVMSMKVRKAK